MELEIKITEKQEQFIQSTALEVLYGGAAGGGKSYGQLIDALIYALKYAGSKQLILRRTFPDLERSLIIEHRKFYPFDVYRYNQSSHRGEFLNGSIIEFGYLNNTNDLINYQGAEYDVVRFDELTHFTEYMYIYLFSRVRGANGFPKAIKSTTNPGGIGHIWVKKRFIDIGQSSVQHEIKIGDGLASSRIFIPSLAIENKFLMANDKDYLNRLENLDENTKKALLYGDWNLTDGQFFYEFDRKKHVIDGYLYKFKPPKHWRRYVSLDYGMDMLAVLWFALDDRGDVCVYRELYEGRDNGMGADCKGHIISEAAKRILEENDKDENIYAYLAPPDLWNRRQETGKSAAEIFFENGVRLEKTSNDRISGWLAVREWLKLRTCEQSGEEKSVARLKITSDCVNLIRCLEEMQYDSKNHEDASREPHEVTHINDALRGFCTYYTYPNAPAQEKNPLIENFNVKLDKSTLSALGEGDDITVI